MKREIFSPQKNLHLLGCSKRECKVNRSIHFVGIGGIGMSALARILLMRRERVSGSDLQLSPLLQQLSEEGAEVFIGHEAENIGNAQMIVFSTDIAANNPELSAATQLGIPLVHRSELLADLMKGYAPLLVTGTHGKTTTSALLAHVLTEAALDPSYAIGGLVSSLKTNGYHGHGIYFVAEADESDGSFLAYPSFGAIITNLENDHMSYWKEEEVLDLAFQQFANQVGSLEHLFWCKDDLRLRSLGLAGHSYGFSEAAELTINHFHQTGWQVVFDITFQRHRFTEIELPLIGAHNVLNAAAVFGLGLKLDIQESVLRKAFSSFPGVGRRLERKGSTRGIEVFDDYAHHPTEIFATLRALKLATRCNRLIVAFQPHRYTRVRDCLEEFAQAFEGADVVIVTDIYSACEPPIPGIDAEKIREKIIKAIPTEYVKREQLPSFLSSYLKQGDVLLTMGAGDITQVGPLVLDKLQNQHG